MWLLREIDRDGAVRRGKRKMKRRVYISKVNVNDRADTNLLFIHSYTYFRGQTTHGILINTISWLDMDSTFMVV